MTSDTGYNTDVIRLIADEAGQLLQDTKGPILLLHGMFSSPEDWIKRKDSLSESTPIQLAKMGYDVWIGCTRGRTETLSHTMYDLTTLEGQIAYWNFSYEEVGNEDISSMVDMIIANRYESCSKVAIVTHSSAANSSLVLAANQSKLLGQKVS